MTTVTQDEVERNSSLIANQVDAHLLYSDRILEQYVKDLGARLVPHSAEPRRRFEFHVLNSAEPIAFSLAGGQIYISRGLLALATSADEVAVVLGHEIGHVTARHAQSRVSRDQLIRLASAIVTTPLLFDTDRTLGTVASSLLTPGFSRGDEREADDLSARVATEAGFDTSCGVRILLALAAYSRLTDRPEQGFFATHPEPEERYERLVESGNLSLQPHCASEHASHIDGLRLDRDDGTYGDDAGNTIIPALAVRVDGGERQKLGWVRDGLENRSLGVALHIRSAEGDLAAKREMANRVWGGDLLVLDEPDAGGRPSVRAVVHRSGGSLQSCDYYQWIQERGQTYELYSEYPKSRRAETEPSLAAFASSIHFISRESIADMQLQPKIAFYTMTDGDSLAVVARRYDAWTVEQLAVYNDLAPGVEPPAGARLKVARRVRIPAPPALWRATQ